MCMEALRNNDAIKDDYKFCLFRAENISENKKSEMQEHSLKFEIYDEQLVTTVHSILRWLETVSNTFQDLELDESS